MLKEFKEFAIKGNLLEIAVAFILALFFAAIVTALVDDVILAFIAGAFGQPDFASLRFNVGDGVVRYGNLIQAVINFLLVAWILFLVVKGANRLKRPEAPTAVRDCPFCTTAISEKATRCPACTSELPAVAPTTV